MAERCPVGSQRSTHQTNTGVISPLINNANDWVKRLKRCKGFEQRIYVTRRRSVVRVQPPGSLYNGVIILTRRVNA